MTTTNDDQYPNDPADRNGDLDENCSLPAGNEDGERDADDAPSDDARGPVDETTDRVAGDADDETESDPQTENVSGNGVPDFLRHDRQVSRPRPLPTALPASEGPGADVLPREDHETFARLCVTHTQADAWRLTYPEHTKRVVAKTVWCEASILAGNKAVAQRIAWLRARHSERFDAHADNVIREIAGVAFSELPGIIEVKGGKLILTDFEKLGPLQRAAIKKFRVMTAGRDEQGRTIECIEVELHDKLKALEMLGKLHQLFAQDKGQTGNQTLQVYMDFTGKPAPPLPPREIPATAVRKPKVGDITGEFREKKPLSGIND